MTPATPISARMSWSSEKPRSPALLTISVAMARTTGASSGSTGTRVLPPNGVILSRPREAVHVLQGEQDRSLVPHAAGPESVSERPLPAPGAGLPAVDRGAVFQPLGAFAGGGQEEIGHHGGRDQERGMVLERLGQGLFQLLKFQGRLGLGCPGRGLLLLHGASPSSTSWPKPAMPFILSPGWVITYRRTASEGMRRILTGSLRPVFRSSPRNVFASASRSKA